MKFSERFAVQAPKIPSLVKEEELALRVYAFRKLTELLFQEPTEPRVAFLRRQMEELNALRKKFPKYEVALSQPLFDLFYQAQNKDAFWAAQSIGVTLLNGFINVPPKNVKTANEVCRAIQQCVNPTDFRPMMQRLIKRLSETYPELKTKDKNLVLANNIKQAALFCLNLRKKPTILDGQWMNGIATALATQQPDSELKELPQQFPFKKSRTSVNSRRFLPKDAVQVYDAKISHFK